MFLDSRYIFFFFTLIKIDKLKTFAFQCSTDVYWIEPLLNQNIIIMKIKKNLFSLGRLLLQLQEYVQYTSLCFNFNFINFFISFWYFSFLQNVRRLPCCWPVSTWPLTYYDSISTDGAIYRFFALCVGLMDSRHDEDKHAFICLLLYLSLFVPSFLHLYRKINFLHSLIF